MMTHDPADRRAPRMMTHDPAGRRAPCVRARHALHPAFLLLLLLVVFPGCDHGPSSLPPDDPRLFHSLEDAVRHADMAEKLWIENSGSVVLPDSILLLPNLRSIVWQRGALRIIPPFVNRLLRLESIYIFECAIDSLPSEIGGLKQLNGLGIEWCDLRVLPDELCDLVELRRLHLESNQITHLPDGIHKLKNLQFLNLKGNPIDTTEIERIRRALPNLQDFKY